MKTLAVFISSFSLLAPVAAQAEIRLNLRAQIAPQCQIISVDAAPGSTDMLVRTACNVQRFALALEQPTGSRVVAISAGNAFASQMVNGSVGVTVDNPGFQTVRITLDVPLGDEPPVVSLLAQ